MSTELSPPVRGSVYKIDLGDGMPPHFWIVLSHPSSLDGKFVISSFTDRHNVPAVTDVWAAFTAITPTFKLAKSSAIHVRFTRIATRHWVFENNGDYQGQADGATVQRALCNLHWFTHLLRPPELKYIAQWMEHGWEKDCGATPTR
jgi:hypothetical protein